LMVFSVQTDGVFHHNGIKINGGFKNFCHFSLPVVLFCWGLSVFLLSLVCFLIILHYCHNIKWYFGQHLRHLNRSWLKKNHREVKIWVMKNGDHDQNETA
jgi:hypothetical protein